MTRTEIAKLVGVLLVAFPNNKANQQTAQVYEEMLQDLDYAKANAAVRRLIATAKFMPTIAEVREACVDVMHGQVRPGGDAWGDVLAAVRRYGVYRSPVFDDPIVARVVQSLGWVEICNSENAAADRARFIQTYDQLAKAQRTEAKALHGAKLPELAERKPVSIGDALQAPLKLVKGGC
jgi:hypothetical protein